MGEGLGGTERRGTGASQTARVAGTPSARGTGKQECSRQRKWGREEV